jgi:hypothetical protein
MPGNCGEARAGAKTAGFKAKFKKSCQDGAANRLWEESAMPRLAVVLAVAFAAIAVLLGGLSVARAAVVVTVDKSAQRLSVTVDGAQRYEWPVSTARMGYRTPNGTYKPQWLARKWFSRKYDWSPMPYSIFFNEGYAIHGSYEISHLGRPASHGCIRLHPDNAALLFALVKEHVNDTTIVVTGERPEKVRARTADKDESHRVHRTYRARQADTPQTIIGESNSWHNSSGPRGLFFGPGPR